ncbi:26.5 kDa heat shock protein, mitochondrial isoform X2 [Rhododendron vialii]|uniref:26.5 kDa heat shock protein, mitochondrial isoform X2 n=1 Tax=Rhododendron vialii TaxID=182163 RepID=UPI0026601630|nr:26.5 kDa heat shock protein, mitochondrial isoform X2 [Rhododendron vialii]
MALARLAFKNMGQRVASPSCYSLASQSLVIRSLDTAQKQRWGSDPPHGFSASSGDHHEKSDGGEVAVSDEGDKKFKLFPRKQRKRGLWKRNDDRNFGLGNALVQATENINKLLENFSPSRLIGRFKEHDECYKLRYLMPGLGKEDVKITVEDGVLRIRGEHKEVDEEESDDELFSAMRYGYYDFTAVLPEDAKPDEIKAEMKDGVLTIIIPRAETPKKDVKEVQID